MMGHRKEQMKVHLSHPARFHQKHWYGRGSLSQLSVEVLLSNSIDLSTFFKQVRARPSVSLHKALKDTNRPS